MTPLNPNIQSIMALSEHTQFVDQVLIDTKTDIDELITLSSSNLESIYNQIKKTNSQILILDISTSNNFSIDLLKKITSQNVELIIVSDNHDDVIKVIPFRPISYLLKPLEYSLLKDALNKAQQKVYENYLFQTLVKKYGAIEIDIQKKGIISFPILKGRTIKLPIKNIIRFEAEGTISKIYLRKAPEEFIVINTSIKECESLLNDQGFFRIHRKHLINISAINSSCGITKNSVKLYTKENFPIARRRYAEFVSMVSAF